MPTELHRNELTAFLLTTLTDASVLAGDAAYPAGGGWDGAPNKVGSSYSSYVVLTPQASSPGTGSFGDDSFDWQIPYRLDSFGVSREQVEYQADSARQILREVKQDTTINSASWSIQQIRTMAIGAVSRNDSTEPSEFTQSDIISVWLSKEMP